MKQFRNYSIAGLFAAMTALGACATQPAGTAYTEQTADGLQRVDTPRVDAAYVRPGADFSRYHKVMIKSVEVRFLKDWARQHREVTQAEQERIKQGLAQLFREVFTVELQIKGGIPVVDKPGPDVLAINAQLIDLDVTAPDTMRSGRNQTYVTSAGSVTLLGELSDSVSGEILARVADHKQARTFTDHFEIADRVSNSMEARRVLRYWADLLRRHLNAVKTG